MVGFQRMNVPASHSEDDKIVRWCWKKNEGGTKPKSVACNEMNAEGMKIRSWWLIRPETNAYIYMSVRLCVRVPVGVRTMVRA